METFLHERGLELSLTKTHITHITDGFDFLGQNIRKYPNGKLLITPATDNVAAFLAKVRSIIRTHPTVTAGALIAQLNPVIRGWANFHRHVVSARTFKDMEHAIFHMIWRWAKRRHPNKSKAWIKQKYYSAKGGRRMVFTGERETRDGQKHHCHLFAISHVSIRRHLKIKAEANPYDPEWELYFEERHDRQVSQALAGQGQTLHLWQEQQGVCPVCQQKLTVQGDWHRHHIIWQVHGGSDRAENLVLLHPNCHRQVHSQKLSVVKPGHVSGCGKARAV